MKIGCVFRGLSLALSVVGPFQFSFPSTCSASEPVLLSGPVTTASGPHHRVVQQIWQMEDQQGKPAAVPSCYIEMAGGLNFYDQPNRKWSPANARFELTRSGHFIARQTQHKIILSPNLTDKDAVDLLAPDGARLRSTILGLAIVDPQDGKSVLLAQPKVTTPRWVAPNQVLYPDAFDDLAADVRYSIGPDRLEQDVILRQQLPLEWVLAAGLDPLRARLVVMTEFFDPPTPKNHTQTERTSNNTTTKPTPGSDDLDFGSMSIGNGQAFIIDTPTGPNRASIPVRRSWELLQGRRFLVEYVDYIELAALMDHLPQPHQASSNAFNNRLRQTASANGRPPLPLPKPPARQAGVDVPRFQNDNLMVPGNQQIRLSHSLVDQLPPGQPHQHRQPHHQPESLPVRTLKQRRVPDGGGRWVLSGQQPMA